MLADYLHHADPSSVTAEWCPVMSGVQVCRFSMANDRSGFPVSLPLHLAPMHFEVLFCFGGALMLGRDQSGPITVGSREILLLSSDVALRSAQITVPLQGLLLSVDVPGAKAGLASLCQLLGDLQVYTDKVRQLMDSLGGCALLRGTPWNRSVFTALESLPEAEQGRYCALKSLELLYLLCTRSDMLENGIDTDCPDNYLTRTVIDIQAYMAAHLDEKLTIDMLSRQFHISPTAFKRSFRRLYGQPVHSWLLSQRMRKAAELLYSTPMSILSISQAVGYEGVSQFNVAFKRQYGVSPRQYRKMSDPGNF